MIRFDVAVTEADVGKIAFQTSPFLYRAYGRPCVIQKISGTGNLVFVYRMQSKYDETKKVHLLTSTEPSETYPDEEHIRSRQITAICDTIDDANMLIIASHLAGVKFNDAINLIKTNHYNYLVEKPHD